MVEQQPLPGEFALVGAEFQGDVLVLGTVDLRRLESFDIVDGFSEPVLEVGKAGVGARDAQRLGAGQRAARADRMRARLLHLAAEREHVGRKPHVDQEGGIDLLGLGVRGGLVEAGGQCGQELHEDRHRYFVHRDGHGILVLLAMENRRAAYISGNPYRHPEARATRASKGRHTFGLAAILRGPAFGGAPQDDVY